MQKNQKIILDVKSSLIAINFIKKLGFDVEIWKTGHSHIKSRLNEINAPLAGEMSGHIFFADKYYGYDDALYASIRLLEILSDKKIIKKLLRPFSKLVSTPEIKIYCDDKIKFEIIKKCIAMTKKKYSKVNTIDGIRVNNRRGWWLLRASNTQPALIVRCEAESDKNLDGLVLEVKSLLEKCMIIWMR